MPLPRGFVPPCLPTKAQEPPSGEAWLQEIKHDGFRVIARKDGNRVRLYSRPGNDLTYRFPLIVEALAKLRSRSCIIDGEAVACDGNGMPSFDRIRYRRHDASVFLYAFDLIELNGDDLRREPANGVPIRRCACDSTHADATARTGHILDNDRLTERRPHMLGQDACERVCGTARRERHDNGDGARWIDLRPRREGPCGRRATERD